MSSDAIRVQGLYKTFSIYRKPHHRMLQMLSGKRAGERWVERFPALKDINLTVGRGETVGIVGRNGSGKSTLLQIICGTLSATAGEVDVKGRIAALLELGAGFNPEFTGRENVYLYGTVLGLTRAQVHQRLGSILEFADIGDFIDQPIKTYSSGMYVRLAFSVAIHVEPDILVVDEALSVGDEAFQRKCFGRIESIKAAGATVLFVSHSATTVVDLCDRAVLIDAGEILAIGEPKRIVTQYQKMLYAPRDRIGEIKAEIRAEPLVDGGAPSIEGPAGEPAFHFLPHWDPGLVPPDPLGYEQKGASIRDPAVHTVDGERVNVLVPGETYEYRYRVMFDRDVRFVRFGMMIRTTTGAEIGGTATSNTHDAIARVPAGHDYQVSFKFRCTLAPGVYFLNAGALGDIGMGEEFLDRRMDVAMFRVMHTGQRLVTGFVDLDFAARAELSP
ncbi:MAG: ABC transporter ATP-binding protein [Pseudoxanthomonas sp.]|jgi:lipopolysaccharide transport system ATP-binding protein|uniref:ABC transporter ATP-binding protein n=1 Tax=Pseudoxanthomonas sp. TaxID=1871049 RepID=UPI002588C7D7|nr:ABC transporter ATP-binding protein [Pseudoxanthomonas sp.]MCH2091320.1 ABC transporter ATP-binding protein [Pseudoxanthomonas sp.]